MAHQVQGVVVKEANGPVTLETILVPDPGPGEVVVDIAACGVCHTDLHYVQGGIGEDFPFLLGHEAAGTVSEVGAGVTEVAPVTTWCSTGAQYAVSAGPACGDGRSTASTPTTPPRR